MPWVKNPRRNDQAAIDISASIIRFGFGAPIVARREDCEIIAGHTRVKACGLLRRRWKAGTKAERERWRTSEDLDVRWHDEAIAIAEGGPVPVRFKDLSAREAHLYAIADNKLGEIAQWDMALVTETLDEYSPEEAELAGWDASALEAMSGELLDPTGENNDGVVSLPTLKFQKWNSQLTDDEATRLHKAFAEYLERNGSLFGFVSELLDGT
jgi:ParB-like chromosome segregation protein Spo0J